MRLSKSKFMLAKQCPKALWLHYNKPEVLEDVACENILETGKLVGELARNLFPGGELIVFEEKYDEMISKTQEFINQGVEVIYEAAFATNLGFAMCDIIRNTEKGWEIYEVKSSTSKKPEHLLDIAFQYYLLSSAGIKVCGAYIIHINNQYERMGDIEHDKLFKIVDVLDEIIPMQSDIDLQLLEFVNIPSLVDEPQIDIGMHCNSPYPCACAGYCRRHIPDESVFTVATLNHDKRFELYSRGIVSMEEVAAASAELSLAHQPIIYAHTSGECVINYAGLKEFLEQFHYPLYFLDFETIYEAIPRFDRQKPFMQVPFQFSIHSINSPGNEPIHREFLAQAGVDGRREIAQLLAQYIPHNACVVTYNASFEKRILRELGCQFEDVKEHFDTIISNIVDLMAPFRRRYYYDKKMMGSYSLKSVLPALFPDDDKLDYSKLQIQNGADAFSYYSELQYKTPDEIEQIRQALLEYCRLDTHALVKIYMKLLEAVNLI